MKRKATAATKGAWGFTTTKGHKQISIRVPAAIFEELKKHAVAEETSIAEKITHYLSHGLHVDHNISYGLWL